MIKKYFLAAFLGAACFCTLLSGNVSEAAKMNVFKDDATQLEIRIPEGWQSDRKEEDGSIAIAHFPESDNAAVIVVYGEMQNDGADPAEKYPLDGMDEETRSAFIRAMMANPGGLYLRDAKYIQLKDGHTALEMWADTLEGEPIGYWLVTIRGNNLILVMGLGKSPEEFKTNQSLLIDSVKSIKIDNSK